MSDTNPIICPALLEETDKIIARNNYSLIVAQDLVRRGYDYNAVPVAGDLVDILARGIGKPVDPLDVVGIFIGLNGEEKLLELFASRDFNRDS